MIQPLRKKHRLTMFALAIVLPIILIAGLMVRRPIPVNSKQSLPALERDRK